TRMIAPSTTFQPSGTPLPLKPRHCVMELPSNNSRHPVVCSAAERELIEGAGELLEGAGVGDSERLLFVQPAITPHRAAQAKASARRRCSRLIAFPLAGWT